MADPTDIIDAIDPATPVETPAPEQVTLTKDELENLRRAAKRAEDLESDPVIAQLRQNPNLIHDLRANMVRQPDPAPATDTTDQFFTDPAKAVDQRIQQAIGPQAQAINEKLAGLIIQNFKAAKQADPFYSVVVEAFDREVGSMRGSIAYMPEDQIRTLLNKLWLAAVGEYSTRKLAERPKPAQPVNLGGGGAGAPVGPKVKRHLREIDVNAYNWAMQNDFTEEQMAEIAEQIEAGA